MFFTETSSYVLTFTRSRSEPTDSGGVKAVMRTSRRPIDCNVTQVAPGMFFWTTSWKDEKGQQFQRRGLCLGRGRVKKASVDRIADDFYAHEDKASRHLL